LHLNPRRHQKASLRPRYQNQSSQRVILRQNHFFRRPMTKSLLNRYLDSAEACSLDPNRPDSHPHVNHSRRVLPNSGLGKPPGSDINDFCGLEPNDNAYVSLVIYKRLLSSHRSGHHSGTCFGLHMHIVNGHFLLYALSHSNDPGHLRALSPGHNGDFQPDHDYNVGEHHGDRRKHDLHLYQFPLQCDRATGLSRSSSMRLKSAGALAPALRGIASLPRIKKNMNRSIPFQMSSVAASSASASYRPPVTAWYPG
jgi:hypothetical protein